MGVCICSCAYRGHKGAVEPHELELHVVVNCHMVAENETWVLCKNSLGSELSLGPTHSHSINSKVQIAFKLNVKL